MRKGGSHSSTRLRRLGCLSASVDSNWQNSAIRKAVREFANRTHLARVPENPSDEFLDDLKARGGPICALTCGPHEREKDGRCIAKSCPASEVLNREGECVPRAADRKSVQAAPAAPLKLRRVEPAPARGGRSGCFNFNGKQFCE